MSKILKKWIIASLVASFLIVDIGFISTTAQAAPTSIALELNTGTYGTPSAVNLGTLASRSGSKAGILKLLTQSSGSAPFTMTGTDGLTGSTYQYTTNQDYGPNYSFTPIATLAESVDVTTYQTVNPYNGGLTFANSSVNLTGVTGLTNRSGVFRLTTGGWINLDGGNAYTTGPFGAVFGPEIWSVPFNGTTGQSVSFDWAAAGGGDDYEIYAFLVKISGNTGSACTSDSGSSSYGLTSPTTTHKLIAYGRGRTSDWTAAAGTIASGGCYRFRFVSGSFDQTGGQLIGAALYVDNTVILGATQTITFPQPSDTVRSGSDITISAGASTNATGATLTYTSSTTAKCTVNSSGVITLKATGTCAITVNSDKYGEFVAAEPVTRAFTILSGLVAPSGQGTGYISGAGQTCTALSAVIGTWNDGGSAITATTYQWSSASTASGTYANISGATSSSYTTTTSDLGKYIKVLFTRTNTTGSGTELSAPLMIATEGPCTPRVIFPSSYVMFAQNGADTNSYPQSVVQGDIKALWKNIMTRNGYTFIGWNTSPDGSGASYADEAVFKFVAPSHILYAQWKLIQSKTTVTWATPAAIQEGTPLSAIQLNALASVPGVYTYSSAAPTVLPVGKKELKVTFVPTDAKYETVQATVEIEVLTKANVTWATPAPIQEGTALSSTQLNATASVPGTFVYDPKDGALLTPGKSTLKVTFTPTDSRLTAVTAEVSIDVTAKPLVIPAPPVEPTYTVTGSPKTTITWGAGKDAATYTVLVDGKSACSVAALTCDVAQLLGPNNVVTVTSVALSTKTSAAITASYVAPASSQVLTVVNFDTAKAIIKTAEAAKLRAFAALVKAAGYTTLTVYGHTDSVGGIDNQKLSVARANAAITYLKKLLPGVTFEVSGFAASKPVADNATAEGKASNRRTEIFIP